MDISYDVARYLAEHATSSIREIEGALTNINRYAAISENKIDLNFVKQVIRGFTKQKNYIGIEEILNTVTKHFGVQLSQLHSKENSNLLHCPDKLQCILPESLLTYH